MSRDPFSSARALLERGDPQAASERVAEVVARLRRAPSEERWAGALALRSLIREAHLRARVLARQAAAPSGLAPSPAPGDVLSWTA